MRCRICGREDTQLLTKKLRRGEGTVYYCRNCDYGMLEPKFDDVSDYYNREYRKYFKNDLTEKERESARHIYETQKNYQSERLRIIAPFFDLEKSFLEIGSSAGQFLSYIINRFKSSTGIELDTSCAIFCKELIAEMGGGTTCYLL